MAGTDPDKRETERAEQNSNLSYATPWAANSLSWGARDERSIRFAISSYIQDYRNYIEVIEKDEITGKLLCRAAWEHCYPPTKILFPPRRLPEDLIITIADYLRLWQITDGAPKSTEKRPGRSGVAEGTINAKSTLRRVFDNGKPNDFCSPVTSCDWNAEDVNMVACCSIDTTVTIWDLERGQQRAKLVAHDKDVYDVAFASAHTFASCGADGSVRFFDLRNMDHSTILYETQGLLPLLRVAWNQQDPNYISTFGIDSLDAVVIDVRYPSVPASLLTERHRQPINGMAWSPQSAQNICTVGEDGLVCIWGASADVGESLFKYTCGVPINNVAWRQVQHPNQRQDWIAITTSQGAELLLL